MFFTGDCSQSNYKPHLMMNVCMKLLQSTWFAVAAAANECKVTLSHSICQARQAFRHQEGASLFVDGHEHWSHTEHVQRGSYCFPTHIMDKILSRLGRMPRTVHIHIGLSGTVVHHTHLPAVVNRMTKC